MLLRLFAALVRQCAGGTRSVQGHSACFGVLRSERAKLQSPQLAVLLAESGIGEMAFVALSCPADLIKLELLLADEARLAQVGAHLSLQAAVRIQ